MKIKPLVWQSVSFSKGGWSIYTTETPFGLLQVARRGERNWQVSFLFPGSTKVIKEEVETLRLAKAAARAWWVSMLKLALTR